MYEYQRNRLDKEFRGCMDGREFRAKADAFAKKMYLELKNMPAEMEESERQFIIDDWFEQYRYIQEIAREIYGEPRVILINRNNSK